MERITLQQLIDGFTSLPQEIKDKKIDYIDISNIDKEDLSEIIFNLMDSVEKMIEVAR